MKIKIRTGLNSIVIISFKTRSDKFSSDYERSKFFRELHGWNQVVPKNEKRYYYHRKGLLDEIPHEKIADSVFMAAEENMKRIQEFFDEWEKKVDYEIRKVFTEDKIKFINMEKESE